MRFSLLQSAVQRLKLTWKDKSRFVLDFSLGIAGAVVASILFQYFTDFRLQETENKRFRSSMGIVRQYCERYSRFYSPASNGNDIMDIHRMPGIPDPIIEAAIESLRVIGDQDEAAYIAMYHLSRIYKRDLLNYIYNDDAVRQWRGHDYWTSLDYVCAWTGVQSNLLCSAGSTVTMRNGRPTMTYYYGSDGEVVSCDGQTIYDGYSFPEISLGESM